MIDANEVTELRANGSKRVQLFCRDESLTRQEFKDECDLELTLRRFSATVEGRQALDNAIAYQTQFSSEIDDFTGIPDFQTARNIILRGDEVFMALPAELRKRFGNDPASYLDFVMNPANVDELRALGLALPKSEQPVSPAG